MRTLVPMVIFDNNDMNSYINMNSNVHLDICSKTRNMNSYVEFISHMNSYFWSHGKYLNGNMNSYKKYMNSYHLSNIP